MKDYKNLLSFHNILSPNVIKYVTLLQNGSLSKSSIHNRKYYSKSKGDLVSVLEYTLALEIVNYLESNIE